MHFSEYSGEQAIGEDKLLCHCLNVRLSKVAEAIEVCNLNSIRDIRCATGAGDGCTACHAQLRQLLLDRAADRSANFCAQS